MKYKLKDKVNLKILLNDIDGDLHIINNKSCYCKLKEIQGTIVAIEESSFIDILDNSKVAIKYQVSYKIEEHKAGAYGDSYVITHHEILLEEWELDKMKDKI